MNQIEQKIFEFVKRYNLISEGDKILVALSGGPDSVFALYLLDRFKEKYFFELYAAHVNHNLRGKDSKADEAFCRGLCASMKIKIDVHNVDVKKSAKDEKLSLEEAARKLRYDALQKSCAKFKCTKIVTAHNSNDNVETVMINLLTGTGLQGLTGIPVIRQNIIRPLLCVDKASIMKYLHEKGIQYRIDKTNLENDFKRNFIRNEIIPVLKKEINPSLEETIFKTTRVLEESSALLGNVIASTCIKYVSLSKNKAEIDIKVVDEYGSRILGEIFKKVLKDHFGHEYSYSDFLALSGLLKKQTGKKIELASNLTAFRDRGKIIFIDEKGQKEFSDVKIAFGKEYKCPGFVFKMEIVPKPSKGDLNKDENIEFISADNTDDIFILRKWKFGDKFIPLGMKGFKKVSDFLNEQKVPASEKKQQLVLVNRNNIVWIPGLRIDNRYKLTENTQKVFRLCMK